MIVGFPGEAEEDFAEMLDLLEEVRFDRVGAFAYSVEEGTRAATMPSHVPADVAQDRLEELLEVQRGISFEKNLALVGAAATLLVDERVEGDPELAAVGRTAAQALDVDGVTHLRAPADVEPGTMVDVHVVDALDYDLIAEVRRAGGSPPSA